MQLHDKRQVPVNNQCLVKQGEPALFSTFFPAQPVLCTCYCFMVQDTDSFSFGTLFEKYPGEFTRALRSLSASTGGNEALKYMN